MTHRASLRLALAIATIVALLAPAGMARAGPAIDPRFRDYYDAHDGIRVLGYPLTELVEADGIPAQYFEKGRIEDHRARVRDPNWQFMYGRLTAELMERDPQGSVNNTSIIYADLRYAHRPEARHQPPAGFVSGTMQLRTGIFVPYDPQLRRAPGYVVPLRFWTYINRVDLFPGGWLHDIGLPMTDAFLVETYKNNERRDITMQAFERAVLTYDPLNPPDWRVERGNIGADALRTLAMPPAGQAIEIPAAGQRVMVPLHLLARVGRPGDVVTVTLRWQDGTTLTDHFTLLRGEDGRGLLIGNLDWGPIPQPPEPATQRATLTIAGATRELARREIVVVGPRDPDTTEIQLFWTISGTELVGPQARRVLRTPRIGTAALEELLWGPPLRSNVGYGTAIPTPDQVLSFPGREPDWGPRVTLRSLVIENGVATADFSQELRAYGGGSLRVKLIRDQIRRTLQQFPSVREVRIAIEGQTDGVLEP